MKTAGGLGARLRASFGARLGWGFGLCIAFCALALSFSRHQFGAYDLSPLIDLTWRLSRGERIGVDFINTFPPAFLACAQLASRLPLRFENLTLLSCLVLLASYLLVQLQLRDSSRDLRTLPLVCILSVPLLYTNHLWHSALSQLLAIPFVLACLRLLALSNWERRSWLVLTGALLVGAKQNLAPGMFLASLFAGTFLPGRRRLEFWAYCLLGAGLGFLAYSCLLGLRFQDWSYLYMATLNRGSPAQLPLGPMWWVQSTRLLVYPALLATYLALRGLRLSRSENLPWAPRCYWLATVALGLVPVLTDWDAKLNDLPLLLFCLYLLPKGLGQVPAASAPRLKEPGVEHPSSQETSELKSFILTRDLLLFWIFSLVLHFGRERERMMNVGPFFEVPELSPIHHGYFAGLSAGPRFERVRQESRSLKLGLAGKRIFFGPRLEFSYADLGLPSPRGLPLWWHDGTSYALRDRPRVVEAFRRQNFEVLAFLRSDRTGFPPELQESILQTYVPILGFGELDVFIKPELFAQALLEIPSVQLAYTRPPAAP